MTDIEYSERTLTEAIFLTWKLDVLRPRYVTAVQVNNGAGYSYSRTLDAIVFDTWPGAGLKLHGLEIKVTKSDLRHELQNTNKFNDFAPHLDLFSIVAPKAIVDLKLLPSKWGLYVPNDSGTLRARRKPLPLHDDSGNRKDISRSVAAAFMRALVTRSLSTEATVAAFNEGLKQGHDSADHGLKNAIRTLRTMQESIDKFEEASGVKIISWQAGQIGEAVKLVMDGGLKRKVFLVPNIRKLGKDFISLADELDNLVLDSEASDCEFDETS